MKLKISIKDIASKLVTGAKAFGTKVVKPMTKKRIIALAVVALISAFGYTLDVVQVEAFIAIVLGLI